MDSFCIEEALIPQIGKVLLQIGLCKLCILRYLGFRNPSSYRNPETIKIFDSDIKDENGDVSKKLKRNTCTACLGLLQQTMDDEGIQMIINEVKKCEIEANSYCPVLSLPMTIQIRAFSIWYYLEKLFPDIYAYSGTNEYKPEGVPMKNAWKWLFADLLRDEIDKESEWLSVGLLTIQVNCTLENDREECKPIHDHFIGKSSKNYQRNKGKGKPTLTRVMIDSTLSDMNGEIFCSFFKSPPEIPDKPLKIQNVSCFHAPLYLAGRYCKFSRIVSQTPWTVDGEIKITNSIEEIIKEYILPYFKTTDAIFSASGREDVDVRTLGRGRPFVLEINNAKKTRFSKEKMKEMENELNKSTSLISIRDLQLVEKKDLHVIKDGEETKTKIYCALCYTPYSVVTNEMINTLNSLPLPIILKQNTPLRVLHRRSIAERERSIIELHAERVNSDDKMFKMRLTTQAGTYVKEFVHGDFGRTSPSISEILNTETDIIALDVEEIVLDWPPASS